MDGLELFSCSLSNEDETALSILDPVTILLDIKPPEHKGLGPGGEEKGSGKKGVVLPQVLEVRGSLI